jgi:Zn-finger nucleic acid-binding protein
MRCPVCESKNLEPVRLTDGPKVGQCVQCGGQWIGALDYREWIERHGSEVTPQPYEEVRLDARDTHRAIFCPECHHMLTKYHVGHGIDFLIDHCGQCNGIWLDGREWEALRARRLHDEIQSIFTTRWQSEARREEYQRLVRRRYQARFGDDLDELLRIRRWIDAHPKRTELLAFLNDPDPHIDS